MANKTTPKPNEAKNVPGKLYFDQITPWQGVYFFTNTVKVGAKWLMHCCVVILVVGMIIDYVFMKTLHILKKKG